MCVFKFNNVVYKCVKNILCTVHEVGTDLLPTSWCSKTDDYQTRSTTYIRIHVTVVNRWSSANLTDAYCPVLSVLYTKRDYYRKHFNFHMVLYSRFMLIRSHLQKFTPVKI